MCVCVSVYRTRISLAMTSIMIELAELEDVFFYANCEKSYSMTAKLLSHLENIIILYRNQI